MPRLDYYSIVWFFAQFKFFQCLIVDTQFKMITFSNHLETCFIGKNTYEEYTRILHLKIPK